MSKKISQISVDNDVVIADSVPYVKTPATNPRYRRIALSQLLYLDGTVRHVSAGFTVAGLCYATVQAAITAASAGDTIVIHPGTYTENVTVAVDNLKIIGTGAAQFDVSDASWDSGVRIVGTFALGATKRHIIKGIAFDGNAANADAFNSTASTQYNGSVISDCVFANIGTNSHLCLLQSGSGWRINNLQFFKTGSGSHALAIRASDVVGSTFLFENCGGNSFLIIKSDTGSGSAKNIALQSIIARASTLYNCSGIVIESAHANFITEHISLGGVVMGGNGSVINGSVQVKQTAGTCRNILLNGIHVGPNYIGAFLFTSGSNIVVCGCSATTAGSDGASYSFNNVGATNVLLAGCASITPTGARHQTGTFNAASTIMEV